MEPRTIKLKEYQVTYEERGSYTVWLHLVQEQDDSFGFYVSVAEDMFTAIASTAAYGTVLHTQSLLESLDKLHGDQSFTPLSGDTPTKVQ
jgi:hypothetical protein